MEGKQEIEKCKAAMADELALKRLKAANETIEMLQRKIAATKQVQYEVGAGIDRSNLDYNQKRGRLNCSSL